MTERFIYAFQVFLFLAVAVWTSFQLTHRVSEPSEPFPGYGKQEQSLYTFVKDIEYIAPQLPVNGVYCYIGIGGEAPTPRKYYLWTLFALAPRIIVAWDFYVHEEGEGLAGLAPSLLWTRRFEPDHCTYVLQHKLAPHAPLKLLDGFQQTGTSLKSGSIEFSLHHRGSDD